jgi:hypothetical protein
MAGESIVNVRCIACNSLLRLATKEDWWSEDDLVHEIRGKPRVAMVCTNDACKKQFSVAKERAE